MITCLFGLWERLNGRQAKEEAIFYDQIGSHQFCRLLFVSCNSWQLLVTDDRTTERASKGNEFHMIFTPELWRAS